MDVLAFKETFDVLGRLNMMLTIRSFRAFAVILTVLSCFAIAQNVYGEALDKAASKSLPQRAMERLPAGHPLLLQLSSQVLPLHLCIYFCPSNIHQYHFTRFHVYAFVYYICFSLSDLLHSVSQFLGSSTSVKLTRIVPFRG